MALASDQIDIAQWTLPGAERAFQRRAAGGAAFASKARGRSGPSNEVQPVGGWR